MPGNFEWIYFGIIFASYCIYFFYVLTLQSVLKKVAVENRRITPNQIWLLMIPGFHLIWQFKVVVDLSLSLKEEARPTNLDMDKIQTLFDTGLITAALMIVCCIPGSGWMLSCVMLGVWSAYWSQLVGLNRIMHFAH